MTFDLVRQVRELRDLKAPAKPVLLCLALRANDARQCWPSVATIALDSGFGPSTVKRALADLEERGLIERERRIDDENGAPETTLYTVTPIPSAQSEPTPLVHGGPSVQRGPTPSVQTDPSVQSGPTPSVQSGPGVRSERTGGRPGAGHKDPEKIQEDQPKKIQERARGRTRGTRLASTWRPTEELIAFAKAEGVTDVERLTAEFVDYWIAKPGQGGVKVDWPATFKNWVRRDYRWKARRPPSAGRSDRVKQPGGSTEGWAKPVVAGERDPDWDGTLDLFALEHETDETASPPRPSPAARQRSTADAILDALGGAPSGLTFEALRAALRDSLRRCDDAELSRAIDGLGTCVRMASSPRGIVYSLGSNVGCSSRLDDREPGRQPGPRGVRHHSLSGAPPLA